jgi:hypothetical protein
MMIDRSRVMVVWHDAHSLEGGWSEISDIEDSPIIVESLGWLLPNLKADHIVLAQSMTNDESIDSVLCIPVAMVKNILTF